MAVHHRPEANDFSIGICDNYAFFAAVLANDKHIAYALNYGIFLGNYDDKTITTHLFLLTNGRFQFDGLPINDIQVRATVLGEMLRWIAIPEGKHITQLQQVARSKYQLAVAALYFANNPPPLIREKITADKEHAELGGLITAMLAHFFPKDPNVVPALPEACSFEWCYERMVNLVEHIPANRMISNTWAAIHGIVAIAKRGKMTANFVNKVQEACSDYGGGFKADICTAFFDAYGPCLDAEKAQAVAAYWSAFIPLPLRITIQQTPISGLTAIITIGRAIKTFSTFPWAKVRDIYGGEFANALAALRAINNNPYYGMNQVNNIAASTRFKNLAYWSKELLVKVDGDVALNHHMGWTRTKSITMTQIINTFIKERAALREREPTPEDVAAVAEINLAIAANPNVIV